MAKFQHERWSGLVLQDNNSVWARFTPETRTLGEATLRVGVFETEDADVIKRLRKACESDENLSEISEKPARSRKSAEE